MSEPRTFLDGRVILHAGNCRTVLATMPDNSVDSVVTDPPYSLVSIGKRFGKDGAAPAKSDGATGVYTRASNGFMGCKWDTGVTAFDPELWADVLRVMKPGAHAFIFGGDRTYHRLVCSVEDGGLGIRRTFVYAYGTGFPKSHNISKAIDKAVGAIRTKIRVDASEVRNPKATGDGKDGMVGATRPFIENALINGFHEKDSEEPASDAAREWDCWGTDVKPAVELICLARKPLSESSVAANVLRWETGAINIGACRIYGGDLADGRTRHVLPDSNGELGPSRWPANLIHDNSEEVLSCFPKSSSSFFASFSKESNSAANRLIYSSKADHDDRLGSHHPCVKPLSLIQYLVRLITPKNGVCLDLFAGTGTTGEACFREGFRAVLIEREAEYIADIERRMSLVMEGKETRTHAGVKARGRPVDHGPLFGHVDVAKEKPRVAYGEFARHWGVEE